MEVTVSFVASVIFSDPVTFYHASYASAVLGVVIRSVTRLLCN